MLCLKCNGMVFLFARSKGFHILCCNECGHEEDATITLSDGIAFYFLDFIEAAYGEDFHV